MSIWGYGYGGLGIGIGIQGVMVIGVGVVYVDALSPRRLVNNSYCRRDRS